MAQNSKGGLHLICGTFQSSYKYKDVTYTPILQLLNLIDGAGGAEKHSEVRKSQDTGALSVMLVVTSTHNKIGLHKSLCLSWMCMSIKGSEPLQLVQKCDEYQSLHGALSSTNGNN